MKKYVCMTFAVILFISALPAANAEEVKGRFFTELSLSNRWSQSGLLYGNAEEEYIIPKRKVELPEHIGFQFGLGYYLTHHISLQLNVNYYEAEIINYAALVDPDESMQIYDTPTEDEFYVPFGVGEVTEIPVTLSANWVFRPKTRFKLYAGLGAGYDFIDLAEEDTNAQIARYDFEERGDLAADPPIEPPTLEVTTDNSFTYHAQLGLDVVLSRHWAFNVSSKYIFTSDDIELQVFHRGEAYEELWIKGKGNFPNQFGNPQAEWWQLKSGTISYERWEVLAGLRYVFGGGGGA